MVILSEQPIVLVLILIGLALIAFFVWLQTAHRVALMVAAIAMLLIPLGLWLEQRWVTEREALQAMLYDLAAAVEREDYETVYRAVDTREGVQDQTRGDLQKWTFDQARITAMRELKVREDLSPPEAFADFTVYVDVSGPLIGKAGSPRRVKLALRKLAEGWKIVAYEQLPVVGQRDNYSSIGQAGNFSEWMRSGD